MMPMNMLRAPECRCGAPSHDPGIMTWAKIRSWMLNPGAPWEAIKKKNEMVSAMLVLWLPDVSAVRGSRAISLLSLTWSVLLESLCKKSYWKEKFSNWMRHKVRLNWIIINLHQVELYLLFCVFSSLSSALTWSLVISPWFQPMDFLEKGFWALNKGSF